LETERLHKIIEKHQQALKKIESEEKHAVEMLALLQEELKSLE
jgi:hypothetical protein